MAAGVPTPGGLSRTAWTLGALAAGLLLGILLHAPTRPWAESLTPILAPIGGLWVAALQMTVIPLVLTHTFVAILTAPGDRSIGVLGVKALLFFVTMLVGAALLTLTVAPLIVSFYRVDPASIAALRGTTAVPDTVKPSSPGSLGSWLLGLVPRNLFQAAASGEILPLLLFTMAFALAAARGAPESRALLGQLFRGLADAMMVLVRWILAVAPIGVFALSFEMSVRIGLRAAGFVTAFVLMSCGALLLFTVALYPVTAILGRTSVFRFARAAAPAQLVAVSSRSSLASLPALIDGARRQLALPPSATGFVLPLSVSVFKVSSAVSSPIRLFLLARVYGVHLGPGQIATFVVTITILTFSYAGIPSGSFMQSMPAYLAAGVPLEGFLILETVDVVIDVFQTLGNVTADMSAATILSRSDARKAFA